MRRLLAAFLLLTTAVALVPQSTFAEDVVDITLGNDASTLKLRFGSYTPPKVLRADRIYDRSNVLDQVDAPFVRIQWPVDAVKSLNSIDPKTEKGIGSQETMLRAVFARGDRPMVCLDIPKAFKGNPKNIIAFFKKATELVKQVAGGRPVDIELFNEPDLSYGGNNYNKGFIEQFRLAYEGANQGRNGASNIKIGGPGLTYSGIKGYDKWTEAFLRDIRSLSVNLNGRKERVIIDFFSYHQYLNWKDSLSISRSDLGAVASRASEVDRLVRSYESHVKRPVPVYMTEYNYADGTHGEALKYCKTSLLGYRAAARSLEAYRALASTSSIDRMYWAQGYGQDIPEYSDGELYTMTVYHLKNGNQWWTYRSSVPAARFVNGSGTIRRLSTSPSIGALIRSSGDQHEVAVWSRDGARDVRLNFLDLAGPKSSYKGQLRVINQSTWNDRLPQPNATSISLAQLGAVRLDHEGTLLLSLTAPSRKVLNLRADGQSSHESGHSPALATDNNMDTRFAQQGIGGYSQFDLGAVKTINGVAISFYHGNTRRYKFDLQISNDRRNWTTVFTDRQSGGKLLEYEDFMFSSRQARYLKIRNKGNTDTYDWMSFKEIRALAP